MNDRSNQTPKIRPPKPYDPQTVIACAIAWVCSDGNSDAMRGARDVIGALYAEGYQITEAEEINDAAG